MDIRILHRGFHDRIARKYGLTLRQRRQFPLLFHLMPHLGSGDSFHYLILKRNYATILPPLINRVFHFNLALHLKFNLFFRNYYTRSLAAAPAGPDHRLYQSLIYGSSFPGSPAAVASAGKEFAVAGDVYPAASPGPDRSLLPAAGQTTSIIPLILGGRDFQLQPYPRGDMPIFLQSPAYHRQYQAIHTGEHFRQIFNFFRHSYAGDAGISTPPVTQASASEYRHLSFISTVTSFWRELSGTEKTGSERITEVGGAAEYALSSLFKTGSIVHRITLPSAYDQDSPARDTVIDDTPVSPFRASHAVLSSPRSAVVLNITKNWTQRQSVYFPLRLQFRHLAGTSLLRETRSQYLTDRFRSSTSRVIHRFPSRPGERQSVDPAVSFFSGALTESRSAVLRQAGGSGSTAHPLSGESVYVYQPARTDARKPGGMFISRIMERGSPPPQSRRAAGSDMSSGRTFSYHIRRRWQGWQAYHPGRPGEPGMNGQVGLPGQSGGNRLMSGTITSHLRLYRPIVSAISRSTVSSYFNTLSPAAAPAAVAAAPETAFEPGSRETVPSGHERSGAMFDYAAFRSSGDAASTGLSMPSSAAFPLLDHFVTINSQRSERVSRLEDMVGGTTAGMERRLTDRSTVEPIPGPAGSSGSSVPPTVGLQQLTDRVYRLLEKKIKMERERRGWSC